MDFLKTKTMARSQATPSELKNEIPSFDKDETLTETFLRAVPKVEIHVHLDGCFDPNELWKHLQSHPELVQCIPVEKKLPWDTNPESRPFKFREKITSCKTSLDFTGLCICRKRYRAPSQAGGRKQQSRSATESLEKMLLCFEFFLPLVYDNFDLLEYLALDFVKRQGEQNVIYTEVRYSPHLLATDPRKAHQYITRGLRKGCIDVSKTGRTCIVNQILCGIDFQPAWSEDVVDMANEFRHDFPCAVVGVDVAAGEGHFATTSATHRAHLEMCQKAVRLGIPVTLHAGETPNSESHVRAAIKDYGARRIGHGYKISSHNDVIELAKSKNIHFENCLTSSVETGSWTKTSWPDHPTCAFREKGLKLSLSSDDPAVFNTSLTWQWRIAMNKMGWKRKDLFEVMNDTIDALFAPEAQKNEIRQEIQNYFNAPDGHQNPQFDDRIQYYD